MRSGTSYFKALLRSDWCRLWPITFVYTLTWFFSLPVMLWNQGHYPYANAPVTTHLANNVYQSLQGTVIGGSMISLLLAMGIFAYLMRTNSVGLMHSLPVTRTQQFISHFSGGMIMLTAANLLIFVLSVLAELTCSGLSLVPLLWWFVTAELSELLFFAMGTLCAMCTGWLLAVPVLFGGINFVYGAYEMLLQLISSSFYYGSSGFNGFSSGAAWFTPLVKLARSVSPEYEYLDTGNGGYSVHSMNPQGTTALVVYTIVAAVLIALSWYFYRLRHSERAGDLVVFGWLKPIFRVVISVAGGLALGLLVFTIFNWNSDDYAHSNGQFVILLLCQILMGAIVYLGVEMLLTKTYKVFNKDTLLRTGMLGIALIVIMLAVRFDITGYQKRTPDMDRVETVNLYGILQDIDLSSKESIAATIALHKTLIEAGDPTLKHDWDELNSIDLTYRLTDGSTFRRSYTYETTNEQVTAAINNLLALDEVKQQTLLYANGSYGTDFTGGYINDYDDGTCITLDPEQCRALYAALEKDAQSLSLTDEDRNYSSHVDIEMDTPLGNYSLKQLYRGCTNTIDLLIEYGLCESADELFYTYGEEDSMLPATSNVEMAVESHDESAATTEMADDEKTTG